MAALAKIIILMSFGLSGVTAFAQPQGEAGEPTPEAIDAAFTREDAARVAAGFSDGPAGASFVDPLGDMVEAADLVFRGTVVSQTYEYDAAGTPYTRTIFSIMEALKGEHPASQVTLVQPGGPSRNDSDRVMMVSDAQYFSVGEEELLFMDLDPQSTHATRQATVLSRFRILQDRVYNEDGYGVRVEPLGAGAHRLGLNDRRSDEQRFGQINIGPHRLEKRFAGKDRSSLDDADPLQGEVADAVDVESFSELIRR